MDRMGASAKSFTFIKRVMVRVVALTGLFIVTALLVSNRTLNTAAGRMHRDMKGKPI